MQHAGCETLYIKFSHALVCVVFEKNREVELCELCQMDVRVDHIDEICVERRRESSDVLGVLISGQLSRPRARASVLPQYSRRVHAACSFLSVF